MRFRRPDRFLVILVVLGVVAIVLLGPWADARGEDPGARVERLPAVFVTGSTTTTSTTAIPVAEPEQQPRIRPAAHPVTGPSVDGGRLLGEFRVTCYGPPRFPAGQRTRSGAPVGPGSIAVDPRVIPLGTRLEVEGYGRGVANDTGSAVKGSHVDVWVEQPSPCPIRRTALVWILER